MNNCFCIMNPNILALFTILLALLNTKSIDESLNHERHGNLCEASGTPVPFHFVPDTGFIKLFHSRVFSVDSIRSVSRKQNFYDLKEYR
eukprot:12899571-Heterocapsa_arctica.AAC.1